jgi:hypothetical protein
MRFGKWNARSLFSAGSITAAARELARYKFNLVSVRRLDGKYEARKVHEIIIFSMETEFL